MAKPVIILVEPQMGENIGAAARAMANFGLAELRIVNPRNGWPSVKAKEMATVHAAQIVKKAKIFVTYDSAISDLNYLIATSARPRDIEKECVSPKQCFSKKINGKVGIVFGRERIGLTNEEVVVADELVTIPVSEKSPSLNIAQAVGIVCYEWFQSQAVATAITKSPVAPKADIISFYQHLEGELDKVNFWSVPEKKQKMVINIRNMFRKMNPTQQEIKTLRGIVKMLVGK